MTKTHVLIPNTAQVACGAASFYINAAVREGVTCKICKKSKYYKLLPNLPKNDKNRKTSC
jgi:hypothetical protein